MVGEKNRKIVIINYKYIFIHILDPRRRKTNLGMLGRWDVSLLKLAQIVHDAVHLPGREGALAACVAEL